MNNLTWLIYLISVVPNFKFVFAMMALLTPIILFIELLYLASTYEDPAYEVSARDKIKSLVRKILYGSISCIFMAVLLPDKTTLVMISASEIGERIYKSEQMKGVIDPSIELLQEYIKREIQDFKKKS